MHDDICPMSDPLVALTQMITGYQERKRPHLASPACVMTVSMIYNGSAYCKRAGDVNPDGYAYPWITSTAPIAGNTVLVEDKGTMRVITRIY